VNKFIKYIEPHLIWIFPVLAFIFHWPTRKAGFIHDFTGWYERYQLYDIGGLWHCFGYHRLQHVMHAIQFGMFKLFDTAPLPWHLLYTACFGFVAWLTYKFSEQILAFTGKPDKMAAFIISILFFIHPFHVNPIAWKVCLHYILATGAVLILFIHIFKWLDQPNRNTAIYAGLSFLTGMYIHEMVAAGLVMSFFLLGILFFYRKNIWRRFGLFVLLPQVVVMIFYFGTRSFVLIDTDREDIVTQHNFKFDKEIRTVYQYMGKHVLLSRFWPGKTKHNFNQSIKKPIILYGLLAVSTLLILFFYIYYKKLPWDMRAFGLSLLFAGAAIAPFASLYFSYQHLGENDRYGMLFSVFMITALVLLLKHIPYKIGYILLLVYAIFSIIFSKKMINYWQTAGNITNGLLEDFRWYDKDKVYVLASPENFKGIFMFNSFDQSMLDDHLLVKNGSYPECEIIDVLQINASYETDGVTVKVHNPDSLTVQINRWGPWYWRHGLGAASYETDAFTVDISSRNYHFKRKIREPNTAYIYMNGTKWEEVDWGVEK